MKKVLKSIRIVFKLGFGVLLVWVVSLFFRNQRVPQFIVDSVCDRLSSSNAVVACSGVSFGYRGGLALSDVRLLLPQSKRPLEPIVSFRSLEVHPIVRLVRLDGVRCPRLHDAYYEPDVAVPPGTNACASVRFPRLPLFDLAMTDVDILGIAADQVRSVVRCEPRRLSFEDIRLYWPTDERPMKLEGGCVVDLDALQVKGGVRGLTRQAYIRPLLEVLDLGVALPYFDAFTRVIKPVSADCTWDVSLATYAFDLGLDLHPELGLYNGVPLKRVDGLVDVQVNFADRRKNYRTTIGPLDAYDRLGGRLTGTVSFVSTNGLEWLEFSEEGLRVSDEAAHSNLRMNDTLNVIGYLNDGMLDFLTGTRGFEVTARGRLYPAVANQAGNDLSGRIAFTQGRLFGLDLSNATCEYAYVGTDVVFTNMQACGRQGGKLSGNVVLSVPGLTMDRSRFRMNVSYADGLLGELSGISGWDLGDRYGTLNGSFELEGPLGTNIVPRLNGRGHVELKEGRLARMKLFMGLTDLLADHVPGVNLLVDQSQGSLDFTLENGVARTDNLLVEGSLFSICVEGTWDIPSDRLDLTVRVRFMKEESILGKVLIRPILWPFTKLLLEFRATGSISDPKWEYISVLDRVR